MATVSKSLAHPIPSEQTPPLENGDRLTRAEFERRYDAMPSLKKAELIEGVVHMPSPVSFDRHAEQHFWLVAMLGTYLLATPGVRGGDNATARLDDNNEPQPDALLIIDPLRGGQAQLSEDGYIEQSPELVAEIASSSVSIDTNAKFRVYERTGVQEYLIWRVLDQEFDWFILKNGHYQKLPQDPAGIHRSQVFPGLWLDAAALLRGDMPAVQAALNQGLASPEHQAFITRLNPPSAETIEN